MTSGFYGWRSGGALSLIACDEADPGTLGRRMLTYAGELNVPTTEALVSQLILVDESDVPTREFLMERYPHLLRSTLGAASWDDLLGVADSIGTPLIQGVGRDASVYGDHTWGWVVNLDETSLEIYRRPLPGKPVEKDAVEGCNLVIDYYLSNLPDYDLMREGIEENLVSV
jgi:hypothetical protein